MRANLALYSKNIICGCGPENAKIMIVGYNTSKEDESENTPLVGRNGDLFNTILSKANIKRDDLYITNMIKYVFTEKSINKDALSICKRMLWYEIKSIEPKLIITLGSIASAILLKIPQKTVEIGKIYAVNYMYPNIMPIWHPSYLLSSAKSYYNNAITFMENARNFVDEDT